ncbi:MAG: hypothetical protein K0R15_299 [Clostridiales bacterium]|jgi:uncharacterized membrane protein|nr:hypothetical protein [Clostridiales bacterium]
MEKYKKILKKRIIFLTIFVVFAVLLQIFIFYNGYEVADIESFRDELVGFQTGLLCSMIILFVFQIVRYIRAMKNDTQLKKLYNCENDERRKDIKQKSGGNVLLFSSVVIIFAGIISGYFNEVVSYTLIACAFFQLNLCALLKLYYSKKY